MDPATISCPACGKPVPSGRRFCGSCGSPLDHRCPSCGAENRVGVRFCEECGTLLAQAEPHPAPQPPSSLAPHPEGAPAARTAPSALRQEIPAEERRLVTALFCDLVGFTPLSEQLDPEEVRDIQAAYFSAMSNHITRYDGTVEKYAGDAVLALFGAPIAHEDDAERAVLCALGMQAAIGPMATRTRERWNLGLAIRVGVNTGEVVSGTWNASGRQDVAVTGDAVNTAARLQAAAEPGEVLVGTETMHLAQRRIRFGERREMSLKGKAGGVAAYPVLGLRERMAERWEIRSERTPLTGRDRELGFLLDAWQRAQAGEGQLISLIGDAGVGKSRLVSELVEKILSPGTRAVTQRVPGSSSAGGVPPGSQSGNPPRTGSRVQVVRGRCVSYGQEISLWLVADLVRALFGIGEQDSIEERRNKLAVAVTSLLAEEDGETQSADLAPERRVAIDVLGEVLSEIMIDVPMLPILVVASQRPGWIAPWNEWGWPERLNLRPMDEQDTALLAGAVLGGFPLSTTLERYVQERTGGNPYFVEELLRALQETGGLLEEDGQVQLVPGLADQVPATLTELLLARLDRLDAEVRSLAQVASVIGRSFAIRLLAQIVERNVAALQTPLSSLQRAEVAFPHRARELEYVFKHATIREVAYHTLLKKRRQQIHAATARAIASLYPTDEYAEVIAYHLSKTDEWEEAAQWLERAGDRAADVYANEMAITHYEEARVRLGYLEARAAACARLDEKLGAVLTTVGQYDRALAALERAADYFRAVGGREGEARVLAQAGQVHYHRGSSEEGIAALHTFLESVEERDPGTPPQAWVTLRVTVPSHCLASIYAALTLLFFATGRYGEQLEATDQAAALARPASRCQAAAADERLLARVEVSRALALLALGHREEAHRVLEGAIPLAEAVGDLDSLARALDNLSNVHYFRGEFDQSRLYLERGLEVAEQMGDPAMIGHMLFMLGTNAFWVGNWSTSRAYFERNATIVRPLGKARISALPLYGLGQLSLHEGDWERATRYLEDVVRLAEQSGNLPILKWAHRMLAERELREGDPAGALARLAPLLKRPGLEQSATLLAPLAEAHTELGNEMEAETVVAQAIARATADDDHIDLAYALRASLLLAIRQRRWDDALHTLEQALHLARHMNFPYGEADYLYAYGIMCKERGAVEEARERMEEALAIFQRLGAKKDIERTEGALAEFARA